MKDLVSICVPTCNRPALLLEAVASCLKQTYGRIEVVVGDDSANDATEKAVGNLVEAGRVRYRRNRPPLGQAGNVDSLFAEAGGGCLVLLHDDDRLAPGAVSRLARCWENDPSLTAAFGKQRVIGADGTVLGRASEELNRRYYRTREHAGRQDSALWSALVGQFPSDGWMALTDVARAVGYGGGPGSAAGDACDLDFSLRLARVARGFCFVDEYTADYRLTAESVSAGRRNDAAAKAYCLIERLDPGCGLAPCRDGRLAQLAPSAVSQLLGAGQRQAAAAIYWSRHYTMRRRISLRGVAHAGLIGCPPRFAVGIISGYRWVRDWAARHAGSRRGLPARDP